MSRVHAAIPVPAKPASVALGELAIAAGAAGYSVTLSYQNFPAPVLCQLYKYCIRYAGPAEVQHIRVAKDVHVLAEEVSTTRLAIVHNARFLGSASWSIQMASETDEADAARPALFCHGDGLDLTGDPGATLTLRGDEAEASAIVRWLGWEQPGSRVPQVVPFAEDVRPEPALVPVLSPDEPDRAILTRFRDQQVLRSLVIGAAVLRVAGQASEEPTELNLTLTDYEQVRRLLQSRVVGAADETCDPLATAMVGRANVLLSIRHGDTADAGSPFYDGSPEPTESGRSIARLITRREVADLGNPASGIVRRLVEYLQRRPDGYERFQRMGLVRRPPQPEAWRRSDIRLLCGCLRPWSAKQVRTHFDPLHRAGLITAQRDRSNGPWQYGLPEELTSRTRAFGRLPSVEQLVRDRQAR